MSSLVFPTLPSQKVDMRYEPSFATTVHRSATGKEQRTCWQSAQRRMYTVSYDVLRNDVSAPAPYSENSETGVLLSFLTTHRGAWDSFLFPDPISGTNVRVRFVEDSLQFIQAIPGWWSLAKLDLIEVL